jgi:hypothetical protein
MKRKGERGSPCLIPLEGAKVLEGTPLTRMERRLRREDLKSS